MGPKKQDTSTRSRQHPIRPGPDFKETSSTERHSRYPTLEQKALLLQTKTFQPSNLDILTKEFLNAPESMLTPTQLSTKRPGPDSTDKAAHATGYSLSRPKYREENELKHEIFGHVQTETSFCCLVKMEQHLADCRRGVSAAQSNVADASCAVTVLCDVCEKHSASARQHKTHHYG